MQLKLTRMTGMGSAVASLVDVLLRVRLWASGLRNVDSEKLHVPAGNLNFSIKQEYKASKAKPLI